MVVLAATVSGPLGSSALETASVASSSKLRIAVAYRASRLPASVGQATGRKGEAGGAFPQLAGGLHPKCPGQDERTGAEAATSAPVLEGSPSRRQGRFLVARFSGHPCTSKRCACDAEHTPHSTIA